MVGLKLEMCVFHVLLRLRIRALARDTCDPSGSAWCLAIICIAEPCQAETEILFNKRVESLTPELHY